MWQINGLSKKLHLSFGECNANILFITNVQICVPVWCSIAASIKKLENFPPTKANMTAAKMLEQKQFYYSYFTVFHWWYFFVSSTNSIKPWVCFCRVLLDVPIFVSQPQASSLLLKSFIITKRKSENGLLIYTFSNKKRNTHWPIFSHIYQMTLCDGQIQ